MQSHLPTNHLPTTRRLHAISHKHANAGFTLVELMIAMILGLLISAAALNIYYTNVVSKNTQEATGDIITNMAFSANNLVRQVQKANSGAISGDTSSHFLNHKTHQGGIVLSADNVHGASLPASWYSAAAKGDSITTDKSDQLTIHYQAKETNWFDCQGRAIPKDYYVIEKYFVAKTDDRSNLHCNSIIYQYNPALASSNGIDLNSYTATDGTKVTNNLTGDGIIYVPGVEYFRVLLGITDQKTITNTDINMAFTAIPKSAEFDTIFGRDAIINAAGQIQSPEIPKRRIISLQLGMLVAGTKSARTEPKDYQILDKTIPSSVIANTATNKKGDGKIRDTYITTILLRNARGNVR